MNDDVDDKGVSRHAENEDDAVEEYEEPSQPRTLHYVIINFRSCRVCITGSRVPLEQRRRRCHFRFRLSRLS